MNEERRDAELIVKDFYTGEGWSQDAEGITQDAHLFEDLREVASEYVSKCRLRVQRHIPESGENILDMASGPIQYREYLAYSKGFRKRHCVDLSAEALAVAEKKIGEHGQFYNSSFFDIDFAQDFFDCSISLHTIYHIDRNQQEDAVRKLIHVTKPGAPVIIVYANPNAFPGILFRPIRFGLRTLKRLIRGTASEEGAAPALYYSAHSISWWNRFSDVADVKIYPWRSFSARLQKKLFPSNAVGKKMFDVLYSMEERFPGVFARFFQYPMIVLVKKTD